MDHDHAGIGLIVSIPLIIGQAVTLRPSPEVKYAIGDLPMRAKVRFVRSAGVGKFRVGLEYERHGAPPEEEPRTEGAFEDETGHTTLENTEGEDLYEVLQVNPKADFETIHRVYRMLALRYHPDNTETGDGEFFRKLTYAYTVLSDPAKRTAHDVQRESVSRSRMRLFTNRAGTEGAAGERRKRQGVLALLYQKRFQDPHAPALSVFDLEEVLGVPREHLEFTLWYLKERALVTRTDNNRFQITVAGVDEAERLEAESMPQDRLLPAAPG